jgi:NADPH-dependent F420 reductase
MVEEMGSVEIKKIGIVGGTGKEGRGLAYRWAKAGFEVSIGSRQIEKAQAAAAEVNDLLKSEICVDGLTNLDVARQADLVVMTVPFSVHKEMLETIKPVVQGKIVIDVTVPLMPPRVTKVQMPPAGSAAQEAQSILGESVQVCSAFQNISYEHLLHNEEVACDVLVCGSSKAARSVVLKLVTAAGLIGWDAGPIENSAVVEGMTSILIGINKQYSVQSAGIRITGVTR